MQRDKFVPAILMAIAFCFGAQTHAQGQLQIPSINSVSAGGMSPVTRRETVPPAGSYGSGDSISAKTPTPLFREREDENATSGIISGLVVGKTLLDPTKDFVREASTKSLRFLGLHSAEAASRAGTISKVTDTALHFATSGELTVFDIAGEIGSAGSFTLKGIPILDVIAGMLTSSTAEAPEQNAFYYDPNTIYAGVPYGPNGEFVPVNNQTPYWTTEPTPPVIPQPGQFDCAACTDDRMVCWCFCPQSEFDCNCTNNEDTWFCQAEMLLTGFNSTRFKLKNFTPIPSKRMSADRRRKASAH